MEWRGRGEEVMFLMFGILEGMLEGGRVEGGPCSKNDTQRKR